MLKKIEDLVNRAVQTAKYAGLPGHSEDTLAAMLEELKAEGEALKKEAANVLR